MKEIICKIFGHFWKTETEKTWDDGPCRFTTFKDTCRICGKIEKSWCTSFEGPTITIKK